MSKAEFTKLLAEGKADVVPRPPRQGAPTGMSAAPAGIAPSSTPDASSFSAQVSPVEKCWSQSFVPLCPLDPQALLPVPCFDSGSASSILRAWHVVEVMISVISVRGSLPVEGDLGLVAGFSPVKAPASARPCGAAEPCSGRGAVDRGAAPAGATAARRRPCMYTEQY